MTKQELITKWEGRLEAAGRVKKAWLDRFSVLQLYKYYEGFQWMEDSDDTMRPFVVNMIYATVETKLPQLLFNVPKYSLTPKPTGIEFNLDEAMATASLKEDALNYICSLPSFGISDKHELAILDAFFGFGVLEVAYSSERIMNPYLRESNNSELTNVYCKHIPFDHFFVSASANWDLSKGKWYGYYEFIPYEELKRFKNKLDFSDKPYSIEELDLATFDNFNFAFEAAGEVTGIVAPAGHCTIWKLWDFEEMKFLLYAPDAQYTNKVLTYSNFDYSPITTLRFSKRRKGWYPLPPIFNLISPQEELNDIRQAQRIHRKRFSRKYAVRENSVEPEELDKFRMGPDGTMFFVKMENAIRAVEDPPLDPTNAQSLITSYDDIHRIAGTPIEARNIGDRTTATQSSILDRKSQVRSSKDLLRVGNFLADFGRTTLKALRYISEEFWIMTQNRNETLVSEIQNMTEEWKMISPSLFEAADNDVQLAVMPVSPLEQQQEKATFMEFLALITQYEILAFSPSLLREAAYKTGYKNARVLQQFQQWAQLAAIGRQLQLKQQLGIASPDPTQEGMMAEQQVNASTPPDNIGIINTIFNRPPVV